jgi:pilus assembly protein CpaB
MRAKSLVLLVIALGCGMIAAVAVSKTVMDKGESQAAEATVEIFVAVREIKTAQLITADSVKLEKWPKNRLPEGAITNLAQLEGKFTNQGIFANEPILAKKISESRESLATNIPPGYRVFDIDCAAGYIKPGDRVDITGTFRLHGPKSTPETRNVLRNIQVIGINGITTRDSEALKSGGKGTIFQLLVKESQLEALTTARTLGELQINLRPLGEGDDASSTDNGDVFLSWLNSTNAQEVEPAKLDQHFSSIPNVFPGPEPAAPTKHMVIITPNGVTKYEWISDEEFPREVAPLATAGSNDSSKIPANPWNSSANVTSGYGGYTPTYPTSTAPPGLPGATPTPSTPVESGAPPSNVVN